MLTSDMVIADMIMADAVPCCSKSIGSIGEAAEISWTGAQASETLLLGSLFGSPSAGEMVPPWS
jgi:hypothetical protein